ncbi:MAG TPA: hypothetical protein VFA61_10075 [Candidatus Udaeobacter sp.]|nr:hypothetical protein [Candidatus Udaeobacter sp.]
MRHTQQLRAIKEQELQSAGGFDTYALLACLAISAFLIVWITVAGGSFNLRSAFFLLVLPWALLRAGSIISAAIRLPSFFALDFLLGVSVVSIVVLAWKVFLPLSLWVMLIVLVIAIVVIPKLLGQKRRDRLSGMGLLAVIVSLVAATAWSQDLISPTSAVKEGVVFKPWSDFFFHATIIARSLQTRTLLQVGNYEWQGFPAIFYHYASYSLASCLAEAGHVSAYVAAVGFWAPFGSFLSALAGYALGRALWNTAAGLAALAATSLIPDGALLEIAHPSYGYFWLQHISPGGLYAVAVAGTALILVALGARELRRVWIAWGVVLGALVVLFKTQVFVAAFPLLLSYAILAWPARRYWKWLVLGACIAAGIALLAVANRFYVGPNVRFDFSGSDWYWNLLANMARGTRAESWYMIFRVQHPFPSHLVEAIGLLLINALGIFAIVAPFVWLFAGWRKTWQASEGISAGAVAMLLLMTFGLSRQEGSNNAYEFIQHPFVWAYWLVGSLTAGRLFSMVASARPQLWTKAIVVITTVLMIVPMCYGSGLQRGKSPGGSVHSGLRVDRGLIDCALYIRSQPPADAVTQDSHLDKFLILGGLSERPSFAARLEMWKLASKAFRASPYQAQLRKLQSLREATNIPDLQRSVRETGIRWYVVHPDDANVWPIEFRDHPIFESNGYKVYDMQHCFDLPG